MNLRSLAFVSTLCLMLFTASARADTDSANAGPRRGGRGQVKARANSNEKGHGVIRGLCTIVEGPGNPIAGPCVNTVLILTPADGNEILTARASSKGEFEFSTEAAKAYSLSAGSKSYELLAPAAAVHTGDRIQVKLQLK